MRFGVIGINFKSAHLNLREALTCALLRLYRIGSIRSYQYQTILLSTCNRSELYFHSEDLSELHSLFLQELRKEVSGEFEHALYSFFGEECLAHLSKVTAGFDSAFLGESDIQRQVKEAYLHAKEGMFLPKDLHYLFQKSLHNGKILRTHLKVEQGMPSLPNVVARKVAEMDVSNVLIVGNSAIGEQCVRALECRGIQGLFLATQYPEGALLPIVPLELWTEFDVVIGTSKTQKIVGSSDRTQMIFDLSMPRCAHPENVPMMHIDALGNLVQSLTAAKIKQVRAGEKELSEIVARQFKRAAQRKMRCA